MARNTLFTIKGNDLVYRNTGRVYQGSYEIKGHTVYGTVRTKVGPNEYIESRRKIGTVSQKLTKKQQQIVDKAFENRFKKKVKATKQPKSGSMSSGALAETYTMREGYVDDIPLSKTETSTQNFAYILEVAYSDGVITADEKTSLMNRYLDADEYERTQIWIETETLFATRDYYYLLGD